MGDSTHNSKSTQDSIRPVQERHTPRLPVFLPHAPERLVEVDCVHTSLGHCPYHPAGGAHCLPHLCRLLALGKEPGSLDDASGCIPQTGYGRYDAGGHLEGVPFPVVPVGIGKVRHEAHYRHEA